MESTPRFFKKLALLVKKEITYGLDAVPTGALNAMQMANVTVTRLNTPLNRDLLLPYLGRQGVILTMRHVRIEGEIEIASSGTAGTAPAVGPLLEACGLAGVVVAGASSTYSPVSSAFTAASIYYVRDGVRQIALGCRGNLSWEFVPSAIPRFKFNLLGLEGIVEDSPMPTVNLSGFITPLPVSKANTTFSLHGAGGIAERVSFDMGQKVEPRFLIGEESIKVTDRDATGSAVIQANLLAVKDWYAIAKNRTRGALSLVHGTTAGNIVTVAAPAVELDEPVEGQTQNILNNTIGLGFIPSAGNDELTIAFA